MSDTSATGGYLAPGPPLQDPIEDADLEDFVHDIIQGVTALDGDKIRPRWQPDPPNLPNGDWAAFGIVTQQADWNAYVEHTAAVDGYDKLLRHENLDVLTSFYGSNAQKYAGYWRDGLSIAQNREQLFLAKWGLIETLDVIAVPSLVKNKWLYRADITVRFRRLISRTYPILNLLSAQGTLSVEDPLITTPIDV